MARRVLLDTGVVVALTNRRDPDHQRCLAVWKELRVQLVSVEGVLVEAAHMLGRVRSGPRRAAELMLGAGTELLSATAPRIERALALMDRYANVPMDFVDALLVVAAEEIEVSEVLTLDRRGFESYRILGRRAFQILPDR